MVGTHQTGALRLNGRRELAAIDALERHVIDPSDEQSATAVLDKISGAVLVETRQKQTRLQLLAAVAEQLLVENKRSRDTETDHRRALARRIDRIRTEGPATKGRGRTPSTSGASPSSPTSNGSPGFRRPHDFACSAR